MSTSQVKRRFPSMNKILTEKEYQSFILERLTKDNGFILRNAATDYDRLFALDRELLFDFLNDTQPDEKRFTKTRLRKQSLTSSISRSPQNAAASSAR